MSGGWWSSELIRFSSAAKKALRSDVRGDWRISPQMSTCDSSLNGLSIRGGVIPAPCGSSMPPPVEDTMWSTVWSHFATLCAPSGSGAQSPCVSLPSSSSDADGDQ